MKEVLEVTVESVMEQMAELTIECNRTIQEERQHWSMERTKLMAKQANERRGHDAIIEHLKNRHLHELEKMNKRFTKQLQEQKTLLEKEKEQAILCEVRTRQREMLQRAYDENKSLHANIHSLHEMMDELCMEHDVAINQAKKSDKAAVKAIDVAERQRLKIS